ncbi:alkaline shock response membrane anchor protein AmaP [Brevibacillus humidisoli]|uniref:alkaline shock response membrane anchor protein AmaP n=1 Tax=Brevibacillus humidisoli TaxID=2895522 RepID=UPI001E2B0ABA|nr:alkaline shock response membrane anchor protein AmaP [Brevibacillus humidisoli]UFJ42912.1 alkaline shock response membrane anchor protein AmaP [Brevibacillus humidisoli]
MNLFDRFILTIYSLVLIVLSLIAIGVFSNVIHRSWVDLFFTDIYGSTTMNLPYLIVAVVFLVISIRFFFSGFRGRRIREDKAIYQRNDYGHVSISLETIRAIAERAAKKVRGVRELKTQVTTKDLGNIISLRLSFDGETPLPELTQNLQAEVKARVEAITGLEIAEVSVKVIEVASTDHVAIRSKRVE